jgi:hypothetical protein
MTMAEVGVNRFTQPDADWYAVTTIARLTPAKSPRGAMIGIARVAWPDDEGTRNASGMLTTNIMMAKTPPARLLTTPSSACSTVSVMSALFITTVTPRASAMMNAAPMKSPIPPMIPCTMPSSPRPPMRPTTMEATRNSAASSGKYQPRVQACQLSLNSFQGMTEKIMSRKVPAKTHSTAFCRPVIGSGSFVAASSKASTALWPGSSCAATRLVAGSFLTFRAYRST